MTSMCLPGKRGALALRDTVSLALFAALMIGSKIALAAIPNVHLNAVLIIVCSMLFGWKTLYAVAVYVLLEGMVYGFGIWWISYLYCWPLMVVLAMLVKRADSVPLYSVIALLFGLSFGALCEIPYLFLIGWKASVSMWLVGIPYDLIHGISNGVLCLLLLPPLKKLFIKMKLLPAAPAASDPPETCAG